MRFEIKKWNAVATWLWEIEDQDICTICQLPFESPCPKCKMPGDDCVPIQGQCNHYFHLHCIIRWSEEGSDLCPLDREKWVVKN
jgi:anaphase-promoting complex subunit 11